MPTAREGRWTGDWVPWPMASDLINHAYEMKLIEAPKQQSLRASGLVNTLRYWEGGAWKLSMYLPLCISSIWPCQRCILYCKLVNVTCWEKYQQPQICRWYHPNGRKLRGTKEPLDENQRGESNIWLKLPVQKTNIMAFGPITLGQIDWEIMEAVRNFILGGSKITADNDCSYVNKRCLLVWRKPMTNLDSIF